MKAGADQKKGQRDPAALFKINKNCLRFRQSSFVQAVSRSGKPFAIRSNESERNIASLVEAQMSANLGVPV
jgi:hypothetical protein